MTTRYEDSRGRQHTLTPTQEFVLRKLAFRNSRTPAQIPVRADVCWRMAERGLLSRTLSGFCSLTVAGQQLFEELTA